MVTLGIAKWKSNGICPNCLVVNTLASVIIPKNQCIPKEPIQKILLLSKLTFSQIPNAKGGSHQSIMQAKSFSKQLLEIQALMKQVLYNCKISRWYAPIAVLKSTFLISK